MLNSWSLLDSFYEHIKSASHGPDDVSNTRLDTLIYSSVPSAVADWSMRSICVSGRYKLMVRVSDWGYGFGVPQVLEAPNLTWVCLEGSC